MNNDELKRRAPSFERYGWLLACIIPGISALLVRGPMPIDETRYLSVAWQMWSSGDYVLPALNGAPYAHKPPLLFWLMQLGWQLFGVSAWWPRIIPVLAALASIMLTRVLARRLHPTQPRAPDTVAWLLAGTLAWAIFSTMLLFDLVLTVCVLAAILALERVERARARSLSVLAIATAAGLLTKGPATLIFVLPPALLAPLWTRAASQRPWRWYGGLSLAVLAALGLAGIWVLLAYEDAGAAFVRTILWDQSASRIVHSFAHARPWWFYLAVFPAFLLPWLAWPTAWRALRAPNDPRADRLVLTSVVPAFVAFSLISGKQPHYLLPLVPLLALWLGPRLLHLPDMSATGRRVPGIVFIALGLAVAVASAWNHRHLALLSIGAALAFGGAMMLLADGHPRAAIRHLALSNAATIALVTVAFFAAAGDTYQLSGTAAELRRLERDNVPIAWMGPYSGQLNFLARLKSPVQELDPQQPEQIAEWIAQHPAGEIVFYSRGDLSMDPGLALYRQPYHSGWLSVVPAAAPRVAQLVDRSATDNGVAFGN